MKIKILIIFFLACWTVVSYAAATDFRTVTFINQCSFPVWFGLSGAVAQNSQKQGFSCQKNTDCASGSSCVQGRCFWDNPKPANGNYRLEKLGGQNSVIIPMNNNDRDQIWSGVIAGRTNCTNGSCETADCGNDAGGCQAGRGFNQPATQAEPTLNFSKDFYDVEVINGVNIPVSMGPSKPGSTSSNPYECGNPGAVDPITNVGKCDWNKMTPPSNDFLWVTNEGNPCSSDHDCAAPYQCGLSFNPGQQHLLQKRCGRLLGYWTANQVCGIDGSFGSPFNCSQHPLSSSYSVTQLYQCSGVPSCYADNAKNNCCGCVDWWTKGINVPANPFTSQCVSSNLAWMQAIEPNLEWLKRACPTAYTFPYDDVSSTFTCAQKNANQVNSTDYTITFCPKG
ncbi:MAG TPA: thaumatin family protein [Gammaproteobacteria bacterium]|nr:thaumatin family protein [Gammaproteobacteria bacterium]